MPGMNGIEATLELRRREAEPGALAIVAMTAHAMQSDRERCLEAGMSGYISKPVRERELIEQLRAHVGEPVE